jgi:hypothetical protein
MKISLFLALAASLLLSGCSVFRRSAAWDAVVHVRHEGLADGKEGYINQLHRALAEVGVEHKVVSYQYNYRNVYGEEAVGSAVAILYRDDATPRDPWWIMDEYHHVPVWLPSWELKAQLEFFTRHVCEVGAVKEYGATARDPKLSQSPRRSETVLAQTQPGRRYRTLFAGSLPRLKVAAAKKSTPAAPASESVFARWFTNRTSANDDKSSAVFRRVHGTAFDPGSRIDREKMDALRRQLLSRNQIVQLRTE